MGLSDTIEYLLVFAVCCILYITLYKHYAKELSWKSSFKEAGKNVGLVVIVLLTSNAGLFFLFSIASYIILSLKDLL